MSSLATAKLLKWNHFGRKNIGYLYAIQQGASWVLDFDDDNCIGCKACMNACPYDAIYLNPQTGTAHKCNFCNHRVTEGLEPSCVVVCPTQAIRVGDLDVERACVASVCS